MTQFEKAIESGPIYCDICGEIMHPMYGGGDHVSDKHGSHRRITKRRGTESYLFPTLFKNCSRCPATHLSEHPHSRFF
jgi:hypothetical protein